MGIFIVLLRWCLSSRDLERMMSARLCRQLQNPLLLFNRRRWERLLISLHKDSPAVNAGGSSSAQGLEEGEIPPVLRPSISVVAASGGSNHGAGDSIAGGGQVSTAAPPPSPPGPSVFKSAASTDVGFNASATAGEPKTFSEIIAGSPISEKKLGLVEYTTSNPTVIFTREECD